MFKHILVPTDFTDRSLRALEVAVKIALDSLGRITLLHVIETIDDAECEEFEEFYNKLGRRASKKMEQIISIYESAESSIGTEITYGKRVREIIRYANERGIDLIVLSSHRIDMENVIQGWGSISYKVSILSNCPVMLVK